MALPQQKILPPVENTSAAGVRAMDLDREEASTRPFLLREMSMHRLRPISGGSSMPCPERDYMGTFTGRGRLYQARLQASISSASRVRFTAGRDWSSCSARLAPTIAAVMPG